MSFDPLQLPFEDSRVHWDSISQNGTHLGVWGSFPHILLHSQDMKCDS
jgi:hypothetical protein